jgi:hypothetical protein
MSPDGADRKRDAFKAQVLALTFHNPHLSEPAFFAENRDSYQRHGGINHAGILIQELLAFAVFAVSKGWRHLLTSYTPFGTSAVPTYRGAQMCMHYSTRL